MECQNTRKDAEDISVLAVGTHKEGTLCSSLLSSYYNPRPHFCGVGALIRLQEFHTKRQFLPAAETDSDP